MPLAEDEHVIQALAAQRAYEPAPRMRSLVATGPVGCQKSAYPVTCGDDWGS
jgi:hypothetical protein